MRTLHVLGRLHIQGVRYDRRATGATASLGLAFADRYIPTDAQILHDGTAAGAWVSILAAKHQPFVSVSA